MWRVILITLLHINAFYSGVGCGWLWLWPGGCGWVAVWLALAVVGGYNTYRYDWDKLRISRHAAKRSLMLRIPRFYETR